MEPSPDVDPVAAAKKLLREGRSGPLATLIPGSGDPYCSLVNIATAADGAPLLLISRLAVHTKNVLADPRVSLSTSANPGIPCKAPGSCLWEPPRRATIRAYAGDISTVSPRRKCSRALPISPSTG